MRSQESGHSASPITFFNRRTQALEEEAVYGERFLRWTYESKLGAVALHGLAKRGLFSRWYGWRMDRAASRAKIVPFMVQYGVDEQEFAEPVSSFDTFNAFFHRRLKVEARPIDGSPASLVFPADGRHLLIPDLSVALEGFFVKGVRFDVAELLRDEDLAATYADGAMLISRLCPVDYHRFHFPCGGVAGVPQMINGPLFSVNPIALRRRPSILWENQRFWTEVATECFGTVLLLEVGATCVGSVVHTSAPGRPCLKGEEKGYFRFGGSCVITLLAKGRVEWAGDLREWSARGIETHALMGEVAGRVPAAEGEKEGGA